MQPLSTALDSLQYSEAVQALYRELPEEYRTAGMIKGMARAWVEFCRGVAECGFVRQETERR